MSEMGNQQVSTADIGWLAGAFDADGSISMYLYHTKRGKNITKHDIVWTNTDWLFLEKVRDICLRLGVNLYVHEKTRGKKYWSRAWYLRTGKISHVAKILRVITPHLTVKRDRAKLLLEFCERRLRIAKENSGGNMHISSRRNVYTEEDFAYFHTFKELNARVKKPEPQRLSRKGVGAKGPRSAEHRHSGTSVMI